MIDGDTSAREEAIHEVFAALTSLHLLWSSTEQHGRMAAHVGVEVNDSDIRALYTLGMHGGSLRPATLAALVHSSRPAMSKTLSRLTSVGLTRRTPVESDGRGSMISLTTEGTRAYDKISNATVDLLRVALDGVSTAAAHTFAHTIRKFTAAHSFEETSGLVAKPPKT